MRNLFIRLSFIICMVLSPAVALAQDTGGEAPVIEEVVPVAEAEVVPEIADADPPALPAEIPETPEEPKEANEAVDTFTQMVDAFKNGNILLGISLLVLLLVFLVRKFFTFIPAKAAPWVALSLGVLAAMASAIVAGEPWYSGLITGAVAGLAATGIYEAKKVPAKIKNGAT